MVELNNRLASAERVRDITPAVVEAIAHQYRLNLLRRFRDECADLYREYLRHCLEDAALSAVEVASLGYLKNLLGLNDKIVGRVHDEVAGAVYREAVEDAVKDGRLTDKEREFLGKLQSVVRLPDGIAKRIYGVAAKDRIRRAVDAAIADERLSPDEEAELQAIAQSLGVPMPTKRHCSRSLERYRLLWLIENGELPAIEVPVRLQRNERCHFTARVDWYELRTVTRRIRYGGPTARIRIAKGVYWRVGDVGVQRVSEDIMKLIDQGTFYVTSKRLIFQGGRKNTSIRLQRILDLKPFANGIEVQKDSGKSPFLRFDNAPDVCAMIIARLLDDLST